MCGIIKFVIIFMSSISIMVSGQILYCQKSIQFETFRKISFDQRLIAASTKRILEFHPANLSIISEQSVYGDCSTDSECPDLNTQVLLVDTKNQNVIACGSAKSGSCFKISLDALTLTDQEVKDVVSTDPSRQIHSSIFPQMQQMIIANSAAPNIGNMPEIPLKFISGYHPDNFQHEFSIFYSEQFLKDPFKVDVLGSFKHSGYTFFLIKRQTSKDGPQAAYLVRICDRNPKLESLIEVKLDCFDDDNHKSYTLAVALEKTLLSQKMAEAQGIVAGDVLFVLFSDTLASKSAICVYDFKLILLEFQKVIKGCTQGKPGFTRELSYLNGPPKPCVKETSSIDPYNFCSSTLNFPMSNDELSIRNNHSQSFYQLDVPTTSFLVTNANDYNVAFVATDRRSVIKVKMPRSSEPPTRASSRLTSSPLTPSSSYEEWCLPLDTQIKEMALDSGEGFYVIDENSICLVKRGVCNHTWCESCIVDPYCGWCIDSQKCSQSASCPGHQKGLWLSDKCPTMLDLAPRNVTNTEFINKRIRMDVVNILPILNINSASCGLSVTSHDPNITSPIYSRRVGVSSVDQSNPNNIVVVCKEFNDQPNAWNGNAFINMTLTLFINNVAWLSDSVYIYDCQRFKNCTGCVAEDIRFPCFWCIDDLSCTPDTNFKCKVTSSSGVNPLAKTLDQCPIVEPLEDQPKMVASGTSVSYFMKGKNVESHYKTGLSCHYHLDSPNDRSSASIISTEKIICAETKLEYKEDIPFKTVKVDLVVDSLSSKVIDNPYNVNLTLFKCRFMALSCGKCLILDQSFGCVWCEPGFCGSISECSSHLKKEQVCPNPSIESFYPPGGPLQGGTQLTIKGTNLGMKPEDVQVTLGGKGCNVIPHMYLPTERVVCNTSSVINSNSTKIEVKVNNQHVTTSAQDFQFKNPQLRDFTPKRGMKSGGTLVTIMGDNLDYGSSYIVIIGEKRSIRIKQNSSHLVVSTAANSIPGKVQVKVRVDGFEIKSLHATFEYLNNPDIVGIRPKASLLSGGRQIFVSGRSFDIIGNAHLVVKFAYDNFTTRCSVRNPTTLVCPTPDLTSLENYFEDHGASSGTLTNFGFILDNVTFPFDKDYLGYYAHPTIIKFGKVRSVENNYEEVCIKTEKSEWLTEFSSDIMVVVGSVNCSHVSFDNDASSICFKPMDCKQNEGGREYPVKVKINNFSEQVGSIRYPASLKSGLMIGLILGLLLPVVVAAIIFVLWYARRMKRLKIKSRQEAISHTNQQPSPRNVNRYQGMSTSPEESIPLTEYVDPNSYQDDAQYLEALVNRLDNQSRNEAKEVYIARERLEIGNQLGKGHFGCVYAATLRDTDLKNPIPVAVKTIDDTDLDQKMMEGFLKEGIIMKNFNHPHVLSLLGLCLGYKKEPMVILPFMANGDLRSYVKAKNRSFTARQLLQLAQQVAEGMSYLASLNFIHRDLAARNCMIDDKSQVKVADFGLSHELHDREYYSSRNRRAKLPIKWMALESLENYVFTIKSDVWSFGVLLWELMTRGITPYPDVDVFETRNYLASGRRLYKPKFCPENVYSVMMDCWQESPERRPSFTDLVNRIELLLNPPKHNPSTNKNDRNYINIQSQDAMQDYLKPISSPPEEDQNQSNSKISVPDGDDNDHKDEDDDSSLSSHGSEGSVEIPKIATKVATRGTKEAAV